MKSKRNKTIDFALEEGNEQLKKCLIEKEVEKIPFNSVVIGDTFKALSKIENNSVDLLIVDPPYNMHKTFHGNGFKKMQDDDYENYTVEWIEAVMPKLKSTASIYVCCDWESSLVIGNVIKRYFILRNRITWQREKGRGAKANYKNGMEDVFFATVSQEYTFNIKNIMLRRKVLAPYKENGKPKDWIDSADGKYRDTCPSNFWDDISVPYWSMAENTAHPTQKPEKLIAKLILASSNENDLVLDPFAGSGTTGVVAKKLNRKYINIEQNPLYCAWAQHRLDLADDDKTIQGFEDGVFYERHFNPKNKEKDELSNEVQHFLNTIVK